MIFFLPVIGCGESFGFDFNNTHSKSALLVLTNGTERGPILSGNQTNDEESKTNAKRN